MNTLSLPDDLRLRDAYASGGLEGLLEVIDFTPPPCRTHCTGYEDGIVDGYDAALEDIKGAVRAVKEALVEPVDVETALEELAKIEES